MRLMSAKVRPRTF